MNKIVYPFLFAAFVTDLFGQTEPVSGAIDITRLGNRGPTEGLLKELAGGNNVLGS